MNNNSNWTEVNSWHVDVDVDIVRTNLGQVQAESEDTTMLDWYQREVKHHFLDQKQEERDKKNKKETRQRDQPFSGSEDMKEKWYTG